MKHFIVANKTENFIFIEFDEDPFDKSTLYAFGYANENKPFIFDKREEAENVAKAMGDGYEVIEYNRKI
jgi:hypothetical protein